MKAPTPTKVMTQGELDNLRVRKLAGDVQYFLPYAKNAEFPFYMRRDYLEKVVDALKELRVLLKLDENNA
jgi:hypothetical protein